MSSRPEPTRITDVQSKIKTGLRVYVTDNHQEKAVHLAEQLSPIYDQVEEQDDLNVVEPEDIRSFCSNIDRNYQRTRKVTEVVEDSFHVDLGHGKLTRAAMQTSTLNSGVALIIAGHNLLITAHTLDKAHATAPTLSDIATEKFRDFYHALSIFVAEATLFATPINYQMAWRGTRYLNNKFLYKLRYSGFSESISGLLKTLHRLILSEVHYVIRGILPSALHNPKKFINYLSSMATQTISMLSQFSNINSLPSRIQDTIDEYQKFVVDEYDINPPDVDLSKVTQRVVTRLRDIEVNIDLDPLTTSKNY